jgi:hypothetical protein
VKRGCIMGLAPMRLVVAAVALVPSAAPATVACRVLVMSTWILRRSGRAKAQSWPPSGNRRARTAQLEVSSSTPAGPHEQARLHQTRNRQRHNGRSRVHPLRVGGQLRVPRQPAGLGACGGRRHR